MGLLAFQLHTVRARRAGVGLLDVDAAEKLARFAAVQAYGAVRLFWPPGHRCRPPDERFLRGTSVGCGRRAAKKTRRETVVPSTRRHIVRTIAAFGQALLDRGSLAIVRPQCEQIARFYVPSAVVLLSRAAAEARIHAAAVVHE